MKVKLDSRPSYTYTGIMPHFLPTRIFLFSFFLVIFLFLPGKVAATAPTADLSIPPGPYYANQSYFITVNGYDVDCNLSYGKLYVAPDNCIWTPLGTDISMASCNTLNNVVLWTPAASGWYRFTANVYDDTPFPNTGRCSANPCVSYPWNPGDGGSLYQYCGAADYLRVYVEPSGPPPSPSTITNATFEDWHNPYEICWYPEPAESQLLSTVRVAITGTQSPGGPDYNKVNYYLNYQSGDSTPEGATLVNYAGGQKWKYTGDITPYGLNGAQFPMSVKGLCTSPTCASRSIIIELYDTTTGTVRYSKTFSHTIDRAAPNYSSSFPAGQQTCSLLNGQCSPKLRAKINNVVVNSGIVDDQVALEPYTSKADGGGFGVDRVDLWVAYKDGDVPSGLPCAPSPPYIPSDDQYFSCSPSNCLSFGLGFGSAWYIGSVYGAGGGTVNWNTTGFATGDRTIVANLFDNPSNRRGANFLTYTGNGQSNYFARVDFRLSLPISPWIKTTGGDVHTNGSISTPGGP